jgi:hypothetical protein
LFRKRNTSQILSVCAPLAVLIIGAFAFIMATRTVAPSYAAFLPRHSLTPGAIDPRVTQSNISTTICVPGYTKTVRPPVTYTSPLKRTQINSGYNYQGDLNMRDYEEDHLIPLEVGGNPTSVKNLFPEPLNGPYGAHVKDNMENVIHALVCSHKITLKQGQAAFTPDWVKGYKKYVGAIGVASRYV